MTDLEKLNAQVTNVIFRVDVFRMNQNRLLEVVALKELSDTEAEIARLTPPGSTQGDLARRGAVVAAIRADDGDRAMELAELYGNEEGASQRIVDFMRCFHWKGR